MRQMRLYVWKDVFSDCTSGMAFAIVRSKSEAIKTISAGYLEYVTKELSSSKPEIHDLDKPYGAFAQGRG